MNENREDEQVAKVQRTFVDAMKRGQRFSISHKEGGSHFYWQQGKFVRSDYGDFPDLKTWTDEPAFLDMLWRYCRYDVTRAEDGTQLSDLDGWKRILHRLYQMNPAELHGGGSRRYSAFVAMLALGLVVMVFIGVAAWQFISIESTGSPLGLALKSPTHVLQLISTTERYLPRLHRAPDKDRFRIDLLAVSLEDPAVLETFTLQRQKQSNALTPMTKILGVDGDVVWIQALEIFAVNLKTKRISREADLRKANPELELFFASAKPSFTDRFIAASPDWTRAYEFSAETLKASACNPPDRSGWLDEQSKGRLEHSLCSGGLISENEWIAIATPEDAKADFKPGFSLPRDFTAGEKDQQRMLYHGRTDESSPRRKVESATPLSPALYRAAAFLRSEPRGPLLRVGDPNGVFLIHRGGTELFAPFSLTRVGHDGKESWSSTTGLGRVWQILPGGKVIAMTGERTPVPGKASEPILVLLNTATGQTNTISLWR